MKNIVLCFDGTWNALDQRDRTNVVKTAEMVLPLDAQGVPQVVFYDEGVGTAKVAFAQTINDFLGGAFGAGLTESIERAYRFLVLNYDPGDRIFLFGFSRGAFSARSLGGLLRTTGIPHKRHVRETTQAIKLYQTRGRPGGADAEQCKKFRKDYCIAAAHTEDPADNEGLYPLRIEYIGVWDTVGALGVPRGFFLSSLFNRKYQFHDTEMSRMVKSARHALAIDERRTTFTPTRWTNNDKLNQNAAQDEGNLAVLPFQQVWFPGDHATIGGCCEENGLWQASLLWVVEGAQLRGLVVNRDDLKAYADGIDHRQTVRYSKKPAFGFSSISWRRWRRGPAETGVDEVSEIARERVREKPENLFERRKYRPKTLRAVIKKYASEWGLS